MVSITKRCLQALAAWLLMLICLQAQSIITTVAGNGTAGYSGDGGQATNAEIYNANGIELEIFGNIYIADTYNNVIRKVNTLGKISTIAGTGTMGYSGDGGQATDAELSSPTGVRIDVLGNIYIADFNNQRIRRVNASGVISTIAGNGMIGYSGDGGQATAAKLYAPRQMAFDTSGNLYFSDEANYVIRKITFSTGIITTVVGNGTQGYSGDGGQATISQLNGIEGLCFDNLNNIYIADVTSNVIRKVITSTGIISTIAGIGTQGNGGDGGQATAAEFYGPNDVKIDTLGNLYIADGGNNVIRKINKATGIISTIAGTGVGGYSGDGGYPLITQLNFPRELAFDTYNNLFFIDFNNQRVRKISNVSSIGIEQLAGNNNQVAFNVWPNPAKEIINISWKLNEDAVLEITDITGNLVGTYYLPATSINLQIKNNNLQNGVYMYRVISNNTIIKTGKIVIMQ